MPPQQETPGSFFKDIVRFAIVTLAIVIPIRVFIAEPFIVNGASMDPTFLTGEYLIVDQISYRFEEPERGEVIVFRYPLDKTKYFIKRVIGLPGEVVELNDGKVTVKNSEHPDGFVLDEPYIAHPKSDRGTFTVTGNSYFVMGDNRAGSSDSRVWGMLPHENIVGRAFLRLLPITRTSVFPGENVTE